MLVVILAFRCTDIGMVKKWLSKKCQMQDLAFQPDLRVLVMHPSHTPSSFKGVHFCVACGGWKVVKSLLLSRPCTGKPSTAGEYFLRRIRLARLPGSLKEWPVP